MISINSLMKSKKKNIIGQRSGMLTVLNEEETIRNKGGQKMRMFRCLCDCGKEKILPLHNIINGKYKSCGCTRFPKDKPFDLTGQRFGRLTVISEVERKLFSDGSKRRQWLCRCDCGTKTTVLQSNLTSGGTKSCGCISGKIKHRLHPLDLTGNRYGKLTVIGPTSPNIQQNDLIRRKWKCRCDCGNIVNVIYYNLTTGHTRSCGCMKRTGLKNKRFGNLTVKSKIPGKRDWICQCDCGKSITVNQDDLFWGSIVDCGCQTKKRTDITNQHFGKLTALRETEPKFDKTGRPIRHWLCRCDCGREVVVRMNNLTHKVTRSCGCLRSERKKNKA